MGPSTLCIIHDALILFAKHPCQPLEWNAACISHGETELDRLHLMWFLEGVSFFFLLGSK